MSALAVSVQEDVSQIGEYILSVAGIAFVQPFNGCQQFDIGIGTIGLGESFGRLESKLVQDTIA